MQKSTVLTVADVTAHSMGPGFEVAGVCHGHLGRALVGSTEQLADARRRFGAGGMGRLELSF